MSIIVYLAILVHLLSVLDQVALAVSIHKAPAQAELRRNCQTLSINFASSVPAVGSSAPFAAISPKGSYEVSESGLELYLRRPQGRITTQDGVNNVVADGATINSTFTLLSVFFLLNTDCR